MSLACKKTLKSIYQWSADNNMKFNSEKFECIRYGKKSDIHSTTTYLSDVGSTISLKDQINDLGVKLAAIVNLIIILTM